MSLVGETKEVRDQVCQIVAWDMYEQAPWKEVAKYLLYAVIGFTMLIYYADLSKPW